MLESVIARLRVDPSVGDTLSAPTEMFGLGQAIEVPLDGFCQRFQP